VPSVYAMKVAVGVEPRWEINLAVAENSSAPSGYFC
jgi:hypothetical protein